MKLRFLLILLIALFATGCEFYQHQEEVKDSGPAQPMNVDHIPDAVPTVEPRTEAGNKSPYKVLGKKYHVIKTPEGFSEEGIGSWYGYKFHGRKTSNGELYHMYGMTAAHKTLPIPSFVRVTNLENNKSVIVRVNDRGPFHDGRIIDLTYAAAKKLGYVEKGTARVRVDYIDPVKFHAGKAKTKHQQGKQTEKKAPKPTHSAGYQLPKNTYLQVGAFSRLETADSLKVELRQFTKYPIDVLFPSLNEPNSRSPLYRVQIGPFTNNADMQRLRQTLMDENYPPPHVVYRTNTVSGKP